MPGMSRLRSIPLRNRSLQKTASVAPQPLDTQPTSSTVIYTTSSAISSSTQMRLPRFSLTHKLAEPVEPLRFWIGMTSPEPTSGSLSLLSSHFLRSSRTTSSIPSLRTSALVTPNTRHAKSFADVMVHGVSVSVVKMACAAGACRLPCPCGADPAE